MTGLYEHKQWRRLRDLTEMKLPMLVREANTITPVNLPKLTTADKFVYVDMDQRHCEAMIVENLQSLWDELAQLEVTP